MNGFWYPFCQFLKIIILLYKGTDKVDYCFHEKISFCLILEVHFSEPAGWYSFIQWRETLLVET